MNTDEVKAWDNARLKESCLRMQLAVATKALAAEERRLDRLPKHADEPDPPNPPREALRSIDLIEDAKDKALNERT